MGREPLENGASDTGVLSTEDEVLGADRKKLGVMKSDDKGQTDAEVKDTDRLTGLGTDRQILGPRAWRESLRVAGSARGSVPALKWPAPATSLPMGTRG